MLAISFEFTANRYHATQWGRHVNEGVLEWPPSPWRILRGIVATWKRTLPDLPDERIVPILQALASELPSYNLPPASSSHTRHYMPYNEGRRDRTTLVIDSFVAIQPAKPVFAIWRDIELDERQTDDLSNILRDMPYLGRAESWTEASICSNPPDCNSMPMENGALPEGDWDTVRTLVPRAHIGIEDLTVETTDIRNSGRIDPESAQWWLYVRKPDCFTAFRRGGSPNHSPFEDTKVVRFAMSSNVLPLTKDTLRWGEAARLRAMSVYGYKNDKGSSATLSGRGVSGAPLSGHQHAFYLPSDEDGDGRLDHLTVWAPAGLDNKEFEAVVSMGRVWLPDRRDQTLQLAYLAHGSVEDFDGAVSPMFGESRRWRSITPYVLTRHIKFRGSRDDNGQRRMVDSPQDQIRREVSLRPNLPNLVEVVFETDRRKSILPMKRGESSGFRPFDFFRHRRRGGGSKGGGAYNFTIEFDQPVRGPVPLGYACHYGLGLFVPVTDDR